MTTHPFRAAIERGASSEELAVLAYDSFVSLLAQYQREEINQVARLVEQELEALVAEVTTEGGT